LIFGLTSAAASENAPGHANDVDAGRKRPHVGDGVHQTVFRPLAKILHDRHVGHVARQREGVRNARKRLSHEIAIVAGDEHGPSAGERAGLFDQPFSNTMDADGVVRRGGEVFARFENLAVAVTHMQADGIVPWPRAKPRLDPRLQPTLERQSESLRHPCAVPRCEPAVEHAVDIEYRRGWLLLV
jgi:hypothetical protein